MLKFAEKHYKIEFKEYTMWATCLHCGTIIRVSIGLNLRLLTKHLREKHNLNLWDIDKIFKFDYDSCKATCLICAKKINKLL